MGVSKFSKITGLLLLSGLFVSAFADINISVNAKQGIKKISPYLFGRNIGTIDEKTDTLSHEAPAPTNCGWHGRHCSQCHGVPPVRSGSASSPSAPA